MLLPNEIQRHDPVRASVEQSAQKRTVSSSPVSIALMIVIVTRMAFIPMMIVFITYGLSWRRRCDCTLIRARLCSVQMWLV